MCGPKFCSMSITQEIRDYAAKEKQAAADEAELQVGVAGGRRGPSQRSAAVWQLVLQTAQGQPANPRQQRWL
jgi:hypothetical protein